MPKSHAPYPAEFKAQLVALVRADRTPADLASEFEPSAQSIRIAQKAVILPAMNRAATTPGLTDSDGHVA